MRDFGKRTTHNKLPLQAGLTAWVLLKTWLPGDGLAGLGGLGVHGDPRPGAAALCQAWRCHEPACFAVAATAATQ